MVRRSIVVLSLILSAFASRAHASWTDWIVIETGQIVFALETATAPAGPAPNHRCVAAGVLAPTWGFSAEVWCGDAAAGDLVKVNDVPTIDDPSVAMDAAPGVEDVPTPPFFAFSDPGAGQIWYGIAGQNPELAVDGSVALSLSLAHFSDGTPFLVYRGPGDHIYTASRKPTGEWAQMQLTNNTSGPARWSVDAVIDRDVVHIAYWDDTWKAIRYARRDGAVWTFETAKDLTGSQFVSPAVAGGDEGRAYIAFAGRDGLLHYLRRTGPGTWSERVFTPPTPVSFDADRGPVGFAVDHTRRAHFVYGTGNGSDTMTLRYVNNGFGGAWQGSRVLTSLDPQNNFEGYRGIDMVLRGGRFNEKLLATWAAGWVGAVGYGCGNCQ